MSELEPARLPRLPAPLLAAGPARAPTSRRSRPARRARARPNCCGSPTRTWPRSPRRRSADQLLERRSRRFPRAGSRADLRAAECWACCRHDRLYPAGLRDAADAPWALIGRGDPALLDRLEPEGAVTVVGARRASSYGREVARELGRELAAAGHGRRQRPRLRGRRLRPPRRARSAGTDRRRARLRRRRRLSGRPPLALAADRRAAASSSPSCRPGTGAWRWTFPARNRIMAALAGMTVVVEAAERSGSLITADLAADLGRDLGAVPGPVSSRASAGPNDLLAGGACVVRDAQDVLDAMLGPGARRLERAGPPLEPALRRCPRGGRAGRGHLRRGRRRARPLGRRGGRGAGRRSSRSATSPARWSGSTRGRCWQRAARHLGCRAGESSRQRDPDGSLDRRLGLRRRRRDPGRPEGVRALRRARDDRDHRDHRAEHGRGRPMSRRSRRR